MTMVKNDESFLDIWKKYYATQFGGSNCYVIDHLSDNNDALSRAQALGVQVLRLPYFYPAKAADGKKKSRK